MITFLSFLILFILLCFIASWWIVKRSTWIKNDGLPENTTAWGRIGFLALRLVSVFVVTGVLLFTAFVSDRSEDPNDQLFWLFVIVVVFCYIAIPVACIYVYSFFKCLFDRQGVEKLFLILHAIGIMAILYIAYLCIVDPDHCDVRIMEKHYHTHQKELTAVVSKVEGWLPDSVNVDLTFDKRGDITDFETNIRGLNLNEMTDKEWGKIGLSTAKLDTLYRALNKMGCKGINIAPTLYPYSEIYFRRGYSFRLYKQALTDEEMNNLNASSCFLVVNRHTVFALDGTCTKREFEGKEKYLQEQKLLQRGIE